MTAKTAEEKLAERLYAVANRGVVKGSKHQCELNSWEESAWQTKEGMIAIAEYVIKYYTPKERGK